MKLKKKLKGFQIKKRLSLTWKKKTKDDEKKSFDFKNYLKQNKYR